MKTMSFLKQFVIAYFVIFSLDLSAQCTVLTGPYSQDFESQSGGSSSNADLPACWKYEKGVSNYSSYSTYLYVYNSSTYANSGSKSLRMYKSSYSLYSGDSVWAMSPKFDLSAGNYEVKFTARASSTSSSYDNSVYIGVTDSAGSTSAITIVDTVTSSSTSYAEFVVDLSSTAGVGTGDSRVVFMSVCNGSTGYLYMDDVKIRVKNSCADITNLAASTTATGIGVSWDGSSTHTSYTVEYDTAGFVPGTGTSVTVTTDTAHLTGLTPTTQYDIYVNGVCSSTSSGYSTKTSAFSPCGAVTAGWTEGFESASNGSSSNPSLPNCWDDYNSGTFGSYHYTYGFIGNTGSKSLRIYTSSSTSYTLGDTAMSITPVIQGLDSATKQVEFYARYGSTSYGPMDVIIGVTNAAGDASSLKILDTVTIQSSVFAKYTMYLDANAGISTGDARLAFVTFVNQTYNYAYLDDISISNMSACPAPVALSLSSATRTSATITWSSPATGFDIEVGPLGFTQGTGTSYASSSVSVTATGLTVNSYYDAYLRSNCTGAGNGNSNWVGPFTFKTECGWFDEPWTETFGYSDGSGSSGNPDLPNCWSYYTNGSQYSYVDKYYYYGNQTTDSAYLFLRAYQSQSSSTYKLGDTSMVILPLTNDLSSGDLQVLMNARGYSGAGVGSQTDNIIVGTIDSTGDVASMHIIDTVLMTSSYQDYTIDLVNTPTDAHSIFLLAIAGANGTYTYGYNEVYIDEVTIQKKPFCGSPYSIGFLAANDSTIEISWLDSNNIDNYEINWEVCGFGQGTGNFNYTTHRSFTLSSLSPSTCYDFYLRANCTSINGIYSSWVGPFSFTTPCSSVSAPFVEDFENLSNTFGTLTDPNLPLCWIVDRPNAASYIRGMSNSYGPYSGSGYVEFWGVAQNSDTVLFSSPSIDGLDTGGYMISFYARSNSSSYLGELEIGVSKYSALLSSARPVEKFELTTSYQKYVSYLDSTVTQTGDARVAFILPEGNGQFNDLRIDSVSIKSMPPCLSYNHLATNIVDTSASLLWSYTGSNCFNVEYGATGFIQGTGVGALAGTVDSNVTSTHTLTGLNPNTTYDFYVENCCNPGTWEGPFTFTTECTGPLAAGTYSVGHTGDFATMDSVLDILNACGIAGAVTFELQTGTFSTGQSLGEVSGSSTTNTITFTGAAGASDTLVSISLDGASNIVLDDLFIYNMNSDAVVLNGTENVTITNNRIEVTTTSTSTSAGSPILARNGQYYYNGSTESNLTIAHNELIGGYFGIAMYGTSSNPSSNVHVAHNEFSGQYYYGAYLSYIDDLEFDNNVLSSFRSSSASGARFYYANNVSAHENHVSGGNYGLYTSRLGGTHNELINNMLDAGVSGIYNYYNDSINIYHNTSTGSYGIYSYYSSNSDVRNNIFVGTTYAVYERLGTDNHFDYNVYYSKGTYMGYTTTTIDSLGEWQSLDTTMNVNSKEGDPIFVSVNDFHVVGTLANDAGDNSVSITVDFDGDTRPTPVSSTVDIGADEFDVVNYDAAITAITSPSGSKCGGDSIEVIVEVTNLGVIDLTSTDITFSASGQTISGTFSLDTLEIGESEEVSVGYFSQFVGGFTTIVAYVDLINDSRHNNDTLSSDVEILDAQQVVPVAPSIVCAGQTVNLSIAHPTEGMMLWSTQQGDTLGLVNADSTVSITVNHDTTITLSAVESPTDIQNTKGIGSGGSNYNYFGNVGVVFSATQGFLLDSVTLYPNTAGSTSIEIQEVSSGTVVWSGSVSTTATGNSAEQVFIGAQILPGNYRMVATASTTGGLYREYGVTDYPFSTVGGEVSITQGTLTNYHYFFYNWIVTVGGCEREDSTFTILVNNSSNQLSINTQSFEICDGDSTLLSHSYNGNLTPVWSTGETGTSIYADQEGMYYCSVYDSICDETYMDSVYIAISAPLSQGITGTVALYDSSYYHDTVYSAVTIGTSPNAYSSGFGARQNISANPDLNSIVFVHRSNSSSNGDYSSGSLRYDISSDGGSNWSSNQGPIWNPNQSGYAYPGMARYPQISLLNQPGNSSISNASMAVWAPTLAGTNSSSWGGALYGNVGLDTSINNLSVDTTYGHLTLNNSFAQNGNFWGISLDHPDYSTAEYTDTVLVFKGMMNWSNKSLNNSIRKAYVPITNDATFGKIYGDANICFDAAGQVGYMSVMGYNQSIAADKVIHPILSMSVNGGNSWLPVFGPNLDLLVDNITGDSVTDIFQNMTGWNIGHISSASRGHDLVVDALGRPHMLLNLFPGTGTIPTGGSSAGDFTTYPSINLMVDLYYSNGSWKCNVISEVSNMTYDYDQTNGPVSENNRPQISMSPDREWLFYSWFESDSTYWTSNQAPDWHVSVYDAIGDSIFNRYSRLTNDGGNHWANVAEWAFDEGDDQYSLHMTYGNVSNVSSVNVLSPITHSYKKAMLTVVTGNKLVDTLHLCQGDTALLNSIEANASSYLWSTGDSTPAIEVTNQGLYHLSMTNALGCVTNSDSVYVVVHALPSDSIFANVTFPICVEDSIVLTASIGESYLWNTGDTSQSILIDTSGTYNVLVTNEFGCTMESQDVQAIIYELPNTTISEGTQFICDADTVVVAAQQGMSYNWSNGDTTSSIAITVGGNYWVEITDSNLCTALSDTISIGINPLPNDTVDVFGTLAFCLGDFVTLSSSDSTSSYLWSTGDTTSSIDVYQAGSYSLALTTDSGCTSQSTAFSTTVFALPDSLVGVAGNLDLCPGDTVELIGPSGSYDFIWSTGDTTNSIFITQGGSYHVTMVDTNGCINSSDTIGIINLPAATITNIVGDTTGIVPLQQYTYVVSQVVGQSYFWSIVNGAIVSGQGTNVVSVMWNQTNTGQLKVVTDNGLCADSTQIDIRTNIGLDDLEVDRFTLYPNPTQGIVNLSSSENIGEFKIYDATGRMIDSDAINEPMGTIDLSNYPAGVYWLHIENERIRIVLIQ